MPAREMEDRVIPVQARCTLILSSTKTDSNGFMKVESAKTYIEFVKDRKNAGRLRYKNKTYGFPVMTKQETEIFFDELTKISATGNLFTAVYEEKASILKMGLCKEEALG